MEIEEFCRRYLAVQGGLPLTEPTRRMQRDLLEHLTKVAETGKPVRVKLIKSRAPGWSRLLADFRSGSALFIWDNPTDGL